MPTTRIITVFVALVVQAISLRMFVSLLQLSLVASAESSTVATLSTNSNGRTACLSTFIASNLSWKFYSITFTVSYLVPLHALTIPWPMESVMVAYLVSGLGSGVACSIFLDSLFMTSFSDVLASHPFKCSHL